MRLDFLERLALNANEMGDDLALQSITQEGQETFTYRQVSLEVAGIGRFLQEQDIGPGSTVGILMENHPRWGIAFMAVQSAGARIVPFDILHGTETLSELIQHSECNFLISSEKFSLQLEKIQKQLPAPLPVLVHGNCGASDFSWEKALENQPATSILQVERDLDEPFVILYTSGTTGNPKGVVLSRRNIYRTVVELLSVIQVTKSDHVLSVLPLYHVLALMTNFIIPLYAGAKVTYLDSLDAAAIMRSFREEEITIFVCVPQFYYLVHRKIFQEIQTHSSIKRFVFHRLLGLSRFCNRRLGWNAGRFFFPSLHRRFGSCFRLFGVGGARFDTEVVHTLWDLGFTVVQAYGMTETAAVSTITHPDPRAAGSVGRPLSHVEIRIDQADQQGIGEVLIRGENIMRGYWKNAAATSEVIKNGWLHSGDLGHLNAEGNLHITGRKKEMIVLSSGKNIFPEELEHFFQRRCPYIKEMCVLGVPDSTSSEDQEKLHAVVVPDFDYMKLQQTTNARDTVRYMLETLSQQLPPYKHIRSFEIRREPLPRTTTRKVKRFQVEKELETQTGPHGSSPPLQAAEPQSPLEEKIFNIVRGIKTAPQIHPEMNLELDLGFDSLQKVELLSSLQEAFRIQISDTAGAQIFTVKELVNAVEKRLSGEIQEGGSAHRPWSAILRESLQPEDQEKVQKILRPRPLIELAFFLTAKIVYLLSKILFQVKVRGTHHLPRNYPYLICPNHLSYLDAFVLVGPLPYRMIRRIFFLGYADYFTSPLMSFLGGLVRILPVDADRYLRQALRLGAEGLKKGLVLCVFPEGERSIDGSLKPFRKGPSILAREIQVPVVPVAIVGTYESWPRGVNKIRLHPVRLRFGEPLDPPAETETYESFSNRLFEAVNKLVEIEQEDLKPTPPGPSRVSG